MAKRKQTPNVLADILGGSAPGLNPVENAPAGPKLLGAAAQVEPHQWEYQIVTFQDYKGWRLRFVNGREVKDWMSSALMDEYLAEMGRQGWELAAASAGERLYGSADMHQLYFKRLQ